MKNTKEKIIDYIKGYLSAQGIGGVVFNVERPLEEKNGDFATNVAMVLAKKIGQNPREIVQKILDSLKDKDEFEKIELAGPGFINLYLSQDALVEKINEIVSIGGEYGKKDGANGKKVVLEHTNVNPNKALHVGHLRNACLGSSIEKIMETLGHDVEVQNYIDDTGVQVAGTALGLRELNVEQKEGEKYDHYASRVYVEAMQEMEKSPELKGKQAEIIHALDKHEGEIADYVKKLAKRILIENLESMHEFEIDYDLLVWESDIIGFGFWQKAFEILKKSEKFQKIKEGKNDGCYVVKEVMGDDKIIVKSNGVVTYTGKDIAYHLWKFDLLDKDFLYKKFFEAHQVKDLFSTDPDGEKSHKFGQADMVVNLVDVRQSFPQQAVKESLKSLGFKDQSDNLFHVGYGVVNLSPKTAQGLGLDVSDAQSSYTMSGRKGIGILADTLLQEMVKRVKKNHPDTKVAKEVALGAIKYYMLNYNPYSEIAFDMDSALDIYGNSGPYLQYVHARCASLIEKSGGRTACDEVAGGMRMEESESLLARQLLHYDDALISACDNFSPNLLCNYLFDLAKKFNAFYATCPIISQPDNIFSSRMKIVRATKQIMENGLDLLGIPTPDKM